VTENGVDDALTNDNVEAGVTSPNTCRHPSMARAFRGLSGNNEASARTPIVAAP
jgi:hypothetical protein